MAREQLKVTGVPFFVFDQRVALAGAQPVNIFKDVLEKAVATIKDEDTEHDAAPHCDDDQCETSAS